MTTVQRGRYKPQRRQDISQLASQATTNSIERETLTSERTYTHTHPFNGPFSGTTQVSRYEKGKTNLDFTEARDSEWQWHQLDHMQVCTLLQTDNHASIPPLSFLQAGCPSCRPTNSVKALKAIHTYIIHTYIHTNLYSAKNRENESEALAK